MGPIFQRDECAGINGLTAGNWLGDAHATFHGAHLDEGGLRRLHALLLSPSKPDAP
jgi:hypothetical protein